MPDLKYNILSVSCLEREHWGAHFSGKKGRYVEDEEGFEYPLIKTAGLFYLPFSVRAYSAPQVLVTTEEARTWHCRLGHRHGSMLGKVGKMEGTGVPPGLFYSDACEVCILGKQTRKSYSPCTTRTTTPLSE